MKAHIKIDEKVDCCRGCPFKVKINIVTGNTKEAHVFCSWEGKDIIYLDEIPSWCPFLVKEEKEEKTKNCCIGCCPYFMTLIKQDGSLHYYCSKANRLMSYDAGEYNQPDWCPLKKEET